MAQTLWEASSWGRSRPELTSSKWLWAREEVTSDTEEVTSDTGSLWGWAPRPALGNRGT